MIVQIEDDVEQISDARGLKGFTRLSDRAVVFAAYRDGESELCMPDEQLTDTDSDTTYDDRTGVPMHGNR